MNKLPNHTALKEWASAIDALGRGAQVILIRKGGLADPKFGVEAARFYLFPTNFHDGGPAALHGESSAGGAASEALCGTAEPEPARTVAITHWAEVVRTWRVHDLETLYRLEPMVVFDRNTLETRYRFRADQAIHVIAVKTWALPNAVPVAMKNDYAGCRSWVSVDEEIAIDGSAAVLTDAELQARIRAVEEALG